MIKIKSEFNLPLTEEMVFIYNNYSTFPFPEEIKIPVGFEDNVNLIYTKHNLKIPIINNNNFKINIENNKIFDNRKIIIGASGGLDSTYTALRYKDLGYDIILVHFKNLNKNYPKETEHIKNFAKKNNFKLYIIDVKNFGKDYFPDNPFKNELILCALTEIGYNLNIKNIMLGATGTYHIENSKIGINVTDTIENYNTFISGLKKYYNNVNLFFLEKNLTKNKMIEYIIKYHKDSLEDIYSCISPNRFVKMLHNNNESKYNIKLLKDRCGSCYKCCMEYILLYENGYYSNKEFLNHCYEILAKSKNSHSPQLFNLKIPYEQRRKNVLGYKPE